MAESALIFARPGWLYAIPALLVAGAGLWFLSLAITRRRVAAFVSKARLGGALASVDWRARRWRFVLPALTLVFLAVALARPLTGPKEGSDAQDGADIVIALDISKSMWADDIEPNRLGAVKKALSSWIRNNRSDRIGLVPFAGEAFVQAPLTNDRVALDFVLQETGPGSISRGGTNISKAIETAARMLRDESQPARVLLLITDGENLEGDAISAAREARDNGDLIISTVGVGTPAGTEVPSYDKSMEKAGLDKRNHYLRNAHGGNVFSRLDSHTLRAIASVGGGSYWDFKPEEDFFQKLRDRVVTPVMNQNRKIDLHDYDEWFQIPLALAILLMVLEPILGAGRRRAVSSGVGVPVIRPETLSKRGPRRPVAVALLIGAMNVPLVVSSPAAPSSRQIEAKIEAGRVDEAVQELRKAVEAAPDDPHAAYNYALALYRGGRHEEASAAFEVAEALAVDPELKARALFQLGNIQTHTGVALQEGAKGKDAAVAALEEALLYYERQHAIHPSRAGSSNRSSAQFQLELLLLEIGSAYTKLGLERHLRQAVQAFDRAAALNEKHEPLAINARKLLSENLYRSATEQDSKADAIQGSKKSLSEFELRDLVRSRQGILSRLEEAHTLTPEAVHVAEAIEKQKEKLANLLTNAAEQQAAPGLEKKERYTGADIRALEGAEQKLDQALALSPDHKLANELKTEVSEALVNAHMQNAEALLGQLRDTRAEAQALAQKGEDARIAALNEKQLRQARSASKEFEAALAREPEHQAAQAGLNEVQDVLADILNSVGLADLAKAKETLGEAGAEAAGEPAGPQPGEQGSPDPSKSGEQSQGSSAPSEAKGAGAGQLRAAAALAERASTNLGDAASLEPDNAAFGQNRDAAMEMLSDIRSKLDALQAAEAQRAAEELAQQAQGASEGEADGGSPEQNDGQSQVQSMAAVRAVGTGGGGGNPTDSQREAARYKDW